MWSLFLSHLDRSARLSLTRLSHELFADINQTANYYCYFQRSAAENFHRSEFFNFEPQRGNINILICVSHAKRRRILKKKKTAAEISRASVFTAVRVTRHRLLKLISISAINIKTEWGFIPWWSHICLTLRWSHQSSPNYTLALTWSVITAFLRTPLSLGEHLLRSSSSRASLMHFGCVITMIMRFLCGTKRFQL